LEKDELQEIEDEREFGNEKNKLVIQPLGVLVLEILKYNILINYLIMNILKIWSLI